MTLHDILTEAGIPTANTEVEGYTLSSPVFALYSRSMVIALLDNTSAGVTRLVYKVPRISVDVARRKLGKLNFDGLRAWEKIPDNDNIQSNAHLEPRTDAWYLPGHNDRGALHVRSVTGFTRRTTKNWYIAYCLTVAAVYNDQAVLHMTGTEVRDCPLLADTIVALAHAMHSDMQALQHHGSTNLITVDF